MISVLCELGVLCGGELSRNRGVTASTAAQRITPKRRVVINVPLGLLRKPPNSQSSQEKPNEIRVFCEFCGCDVTKFLCELCVLCGGKLFVAVAA